ncbi:MAG: hypothetical protein ACI9UA_006137, partial [Pseudoalteromonas tetraodonis]
QADPLRHWCEFPHLKVDQTHEQNILSTRRSTQSASRPPRDATCRDLRCARIAADV